MSGARRSSMTVTGGSWNMWGYNAFGLSLVPLLIGIGFLFYDGRSIVGWFLAGAGALIIFLGIIAHLNIFFRPTTLFDTLLMLALLAGGLGLVARSVRSYGTTAATTPDQNKNPT